MAIGAEALETGVAHALLHLVAEARQLEAVLAAVAAEDVTAGTAVVAAPTRAERTAITTRITRRLGDLGPR